MKKMLALTFALVIVLSLATCDGNSNSTSGTIENNSADKKSAGGNIVSTNSDVRIKLTFNNEEVIVGSLPPIS